MCGRYASSRRPEDLAAEFGVEPFDGLLEAYPVSPAVGNVRNNGPHLAEPVHPGQDPSRLDLTSLG